jgi:magnesium transporter
MIRSFVFSEGKLVGQDLEAEAMRLVRADKGLHLWVDLDNPTDEEIRLVLESVFQFHPLSVEDCVAPTSLPKVEDYDDYLFIVSHAVDFTRTEKFNTTELDLFLGSEFLVTFHRAPLRSVQAAIDRCTKSTGPVVRSPDRLAHFILDQLFDHYTPVLAELRGELEEIEEIVVAKSPQNLIPELLHVRTDITRLREIVRPQREVASRLAQSATKLIRPTQIPYFRDLRDSLIRIDETAAGFADQLLISFDLYLSKSDYEANQGIKTLTALTALTLPATIISTWYGMNFDMPELRPAWGYPVCAAVTLALTGLTWWWCKRRRWI